MEKRKESFGSFDVTPSWPCAARIMSGLGRGGGTRVGVLPFFFAIMVFFFRPDNVSYMFQPDMNRIESSNAAVVSLLSPWVYTYLYIRCGRW